MKSIALLILFGFSHFAFSDDRDNQYNSDSCVAEIAYSRQGLVDPSITIAPVLLNDKQARRLCLGAINAAPRVCYSDLAGYFTATSKEVLVTLCSGATSWNQRTYCFTQSMVTGGLSDVEAAIQCSIDDSKIHLSSK
ncbi:MAG: hypothetical protein IT289_08645 [Oligoflexia bacterium]|nr:hypothetical protein [Oligoflexia bacterium]